MAQANAAGGAGQGLVAQQPGEVPNADNGPPAVAAAPAAPARQVAHGGVAVAGPVIANLAGALPPPPPRFDIEAALVMSPLPTLNDIRYSIHPKI